MKILFAMSSLALLSGFVMGDTILENGGGPTFTNFPTNMATPLGTGTPFWDNHSGDFGGTNTANIGYFLGATGNFNGGTNYQANGYLSGAGSGGTNDAVPAFNLVHTTNSLFISLLGAYTGNTTNMFGIYNASLTGAAATSSEIALFGSTAATGTTANQSAVSFSNVGFYMTNSTNGVTWFSNSAMNTAAASGDPTGHQHFALFTTSTDPNIFFLGVTDWAFGNGGEGNGDYNDFLVKINASAVPEPATFALMGAGLLGLGFVRFRVRNRA
jgi:hypothetical protein